MKCSSCGKGVMYGHNVSHSKRRTRKIFKPNLHQTRVVLNGTSMRLKLCTKCQRTFKKLTAPVPELADIITEPQAATV